MKLFFSPTSPYVRKCLVSAHELGIADQIELLASNVNPVNRDRTVVDVNPLGKVPTLITDAGVALYDSRVICEYLNSRANGGLFPKDGDARWETLTLQALGDGMMDALLLARYEETMRSDALRWKVWLDGQLDKVNTSMTALERDTRRLNGRVDIGSITLGCAVWYLDLRFPHFEWRSRFPSFARWVADFAQRESMKANWSLE